MGVRCAIDGCETDAYLRGWCSIHYRRWLRHGDPLVVKKAAPRKPSVKPGDVYHRLTVIAETPKRSGGHRTFLCRCECGNEIVADGNALRRGNTKSCGCLKLEVLATREYRHGHRKQRDGGPSRTYVTWSSVLDRTTNPNSSGWGYYGGRGITVCDRWNPRAGGSFANFLADMGERPEGKTIDRIDVNGHYEPGNCRWATHSEQMRNRRPRVPAQSG